MSTLVSIAENLPELGPQTTFADIENIKNQIIKGRAHLQVVIVELQNTQRPNPYKQLLKYTEYIMQYIKSSGISLQAAEKALSSGDIGKMKDAVDEMKRKILNIAEIKQEKEKLLIQFGIKA